MRNHLLLSLCFILALGASAQRSGLQQLNTPVDSLTLPYYTTNDQSLPIYNGRMFYSYLPISKGTPFYGGDQWKNGSICYDGTWYFNITMLYDAITDLVIVQSPRFVALTTLAPRIQQFRWDSASFVRLFPDKDHIVKEGFYRVLSKGPVTVFARHVSYLNAVVNGNQLDHEIEAKVSYYALKDGKYFEIKRAKTLLTLLKDKRQQVSPYMRAQKINRNERERAITTMANFYNQLQP